MYAGHFAAALALKAAKPETPTWGLLFGTGLMDVAYGGLVVIGVEGAAPDYLISHRLDIPWSHSLALACLFALIFAAFFYRRGWSVVGVVGLAVISHWALDILVHRPDMSVAPGFGPLLGFADRFGGVSGWFETLLVLACIGFYMWRSGDRSRFGGRRLVVCAVVSLAWAMGKAA
jgi:membrane-bound metal-dependent hydrolase YbcI (DUF457 family)